MSISECGKYQFVAHRTFANRELPIWEVKEASRIVNIHHTISKSSLY